MDEFPPASPENPSGQSASVPPPPRPAAQVPPPLLSQPIVVQTRQKRGSGWKIVAILFIVLFLFSLVFNPLHFLARIFSGEGASMQGHKTVGPRLQESYLEDNGSKNK